MKINYIILFNKYFYLTYYFFSIFMMCFVYKNFYITTIISSLFLIELFFIIKFNKIIGNRKPFGTILIMIFMILSNVILDYHQYLFFLAGIIYLLTLLDYKEMYINISNIKSNNDKIISNYEFILQTNGFQFFTAFKNNIGFQYYDNYKIFNIKYNKKNYSHKSVLNFIKTKGIEIEDLTAEDFKIIDMIEY